MWYICNYILQVSLYLLENRYKCSEILQHIIVELFFLRIVHAGWEILSWSVQKHGHIFIAILLTDPAYTTYTLNIKSTSLRWINIESMLIQFWMPSGATDFLFFCLLSCAMRVFWNGIFFKRKKLLIWENSICLRSYPLWGYRSMYEKVKSLPLKACPGTRNHTQTISSLHTNTLMSNLSCISQVIKLSGISYYLVSCYRRYKVAAQVDIMIPWLYCLVQFW